MALLKSLADGRFCVIVEFTPHSISDLRRVSKVVQHLPELGSRFADRGVVFPAVSITQNPGGRPSYDTVAAVAALRAQGIPPGIEILPHVSGKDMNGDAMTALLRALADDGIRTILALTGDLPAGRGVFERDAVGILQLVGEVNWSRACARSACR